MKRGVGNRRYTFKQHKRYMEGHYEEALVLFVVIRNGPICISAALDQLLATFFAL